MVLISLADIRKHFGPDPVLDGITVDVRPGERIGLVGPNGAGKSTLLNIIAGDLEADGGAVQRRDGIRVGYLRQQSDIDPRWTVWQAAEQALGELVALAQQSEALATRMAEADTDEHPQLARRFDAIQEELTRQDGYALDHKIERVLHGLGFERVSYHQPVGQLSGGQQNRLMLARLLLERPEVLLLDEPTNHLDIEATGWLEDYLISSDQTLIVVSHDRYFLDKVTNLTWELFQGTIDRFRGNFSAYWRQKRERLEVQRRTFENQQTEIAKLQDFVRRHHHGQKHAQAEDRRKKLERIQRVAPPREILSPAMRFPPAARSGDIVVRTEGLTKGYDQTLFENVRLDVQRGERWGILGGNGTGKTTLLKCLLGLLEPDEGRSMLGTGVVVGYFDQLLADLDDRLPAVEAVRPLTGELHEPERRKLLAQFGVRGDTALQPVGTLSGGERNRVALARLAATRANLLALDEPTNHLDLWARDALEQALCNFDGTVVFVSHDRYFLNRVADHVIELDAGCVQVVPGNYDLLVHLKQKAKQDSAVQTAQSSPDGRRPTAGDRTRASKPRRRFPYRKVEEIEQDIHDHEARIEQLHRQLTQPDVLRDSQAVKRVQTDLAESHARLEQLYEHWEEAAELN